MKPEIIQIRADICSDCKRDCNVRTTINHADPDAACPQHVWHKFSGNPKEPAIAEGGEISRAAPSEAPIRAPSLFSQIFRPRSCCGKKQ